MILIKEKILMMMMMKVIIIIIIIIIIAINIVRGKLQINEELTLRSSKY